MKLISKEDVRKAWADTATLRQGGGMKLVSREDVHKAWAEHRKDWGWGSKVYTTEQYEAARAYYRYLKIRRRYETGE